MKIEDIQTALEQVSEEKIGQIVDLVEAHDKIIIIDDYSNISSDHQRHSIQLSVRTTIARS